MRKSVKRWSAIGAASMVVASGLVLGSFTTQAVADTRCTTSRIQINGNPGAEAPSWADGHRHDTGNHYVGAIWYADGPDLWDWWADNNGGNDGDTKDTYYSSRWC